MRSTDSLSALHQIFHDYLTHIVNTSQDDFRIIFHTTIPDIPKQMIEPTRLPTGQQVVKELEIHVLTPAFYSRLVHYASTAEAFDRECIFTDEKNRTCWISRPELLAQLISQSRAVLSGNTPLSGRGQLNKFQWSLLERLRCAPAEPAYNTTPKNSESNLVDIRPARLSDLDNFVISQQGKTYTGEYRRIVTKLFLAQRFCFGFPQVITLVDVMLRISLCYLAARQMSSSSEFTLSTLLIWEWWSLSTVIGAVTANHAYGLLKGYF
jgi:hypothetical protein